MGSELTDYSEKIFEDIKHINEYGQEFWYARELQTALEYSQWRRFAETIERAKKACENSGNAVSEHFADVGKSSPMPNGGIRQLKIPVMMIVTTTNKKILHQNMDNT